MSDRLDRSAGMVAKATRLTDTTTTIGWATGCPTNCPTGCPTGWATGWATGLETSMVHTKRKPFGYLKLVLGKQVVDSGLLKLIVIVEKQLNEYSDLRTAGVGQFHCEIDPPTNKRRRKESASK